MPTDDIDFEDFDRERMKPIKPPTISIHRDGTLLINTTAYDLLGQPTAVILSYGRKRPVVGIRRAEPETAGACRITLDKRNVSYNVGATAFCDHYKIDRTQARRYEMTKYGERFGIDLTAPVAITSRPKGSSGTTRKAKGK